MTTIENSELIAALHYRVNNPSAWPEGFDQEASDLFAAAVLALTTPHKPVTDEMVERAAMAIADAWGETWQCVCTSNRGLDCDCGDAMTDEREPYDESLSREDCRMGARAALEAAQLPARPVVTGEMIERLARFNCPHPWDEISPMVRASYRLSAQSMLHAALSALEGEQP